jgi:hypothetical protein
MILEQNTRRIFAAAQARDLDALRFASGEREAAIAMLASIPPTHALRDAVEASIAAGEEAKVAIRAIQQSLRKESRRLANIKQGFLHVSETHRIDCKG